MMIISGIVYFSLAKTLVTYASLSSGADGAKACDQDEEFIFQTRVKNTINDLRIQDDHTVTKLVPGPTVMIKVPSNNGFPSQMAGSDFADESYQNNQLNWPPSEDIFNLRRPCSSKNRRILHQHEPLASVTTCVNASALLQSVSMSASMESASVSAKLAMSSVSAQLASSASLVSSSIASVISVASVSAQMASSAAVQSSMMAVSASMASMEAKLAILLSQKSRTLDEYSIQSSYLSSYTTTNTSLLPSTSYYSSASVVTYPTSSSVFSPTFNWSSLTTHPTYGSWTAISTSLTTTFGSMASSYRQNLSSAASLVSTNVTAAMQSYVSDHYSVSTSSSPSSTSTTA